MRFHFQNQNSILKSLTVCLMATSVCRSTVAQSSGDYDNYGGNDSSSYQDYTDPYTQPDNLYADYAATKMEGDNNRGGGGIGMGQFIVGVSLSWFMGGKIHSGRVAKKLKAKHQKEQKALYSQYYNDVYKLSEQNQELLSYVETLQDTLKQTEAKHELEAIQRDYDEFKQPDIDGDDRISRAEFNMYVKNYLSNYPGLSEADYPKFEDFDRDGDGFVSFKEYAEQMALQSQQAELDQLYGKKQNQGLQDLYKDSAKKAKSAYR